MRAKPKEASPVLHPLAVAQAVDRRLKQLNGQTSGWYVRDAQGTLGAWAPEIFGFYDYAIAEKAPNADDVYSRVAPADVKLILEQMRAAADRQIPFDFKYRIRTPSREIRTLRNRGHTVVEKGRILALGIVTNITQEESAFDELDAALKSLTGTSPRASKPAALDNEANPPAPVKTGSPLSQYQLNKVLTLIEENMVSGIGVEEMARAVGMSCAFFARAFKVAMGTSPHRFLLDLRLEKAQAALADCRAHMKISGLAADLGFFDQAHLTKYFRQKFGQTPGQFLRTHAIAKDH